MKTSRIPLLSTVTSLTLPRMLSAAESKTTKRPLSLIQGRKASPPPALLLISRSVVPAAPQFTLPAGMVVGVVVVGVPGIVVVVPPGPVVVGVPGWVVWVPGSPVGGAAARPTIGRFRRMAPVDPKKPASP